MNKERLIKYYKTSLSSLYHQIFGIIFEAQTSLQDLGSNAATLKGIDSNQEKSYFEQKKINQLLISLLYRVNAMEERAHQGSQMYYISSNESPFMVTTVSHYLVVMFVIILSLILYKGVRRIFEVGHSKTPKVLLIVHGAILTVPSYSFGIVFYKVLKYLAYKGEGDGVK
jgi:hypothetical protein